MFRKSVNTVNIEGYLKENTLKYVDNNPDAISGNVTVAVDEHSEFRIQYYVNRYFDKEKTKENSAFENFDKMLAQFTTSFAKLQESNPNVTFEEAKNSITKVRAIGSFSEYPRINKNTGKQESLITLRGSRLYVAGVSHELEPSARFEVEAFLQSKQEEVKNEETTGRLILHTLVPDYSLGVIELDFVVPEDFAEGVNDNYDVGQTIRIRGDLKHTVVKKLVKAATKSLFGSASKAQYTTEFTDERVVDGGDPACEYDEEDENTLGFSPADVKEALATRKEKVAERLAKSMETPKTAAKPAGKPAGKPKFSF